MRESFYISTPVAVLLGAVLVSISILISGGIIKIGRQAPASASPAPAAQPQPVGPVKVALDDDPILGDKNAPITLIEFSDYECPFCKRHFDQTYPELKKNYFDTGKVKLVFRDYPLPFHDPMATVEAQAANCAREQGGDVTYFKFHDEMFKRTTSNGNGLDNDKIFKIAADLGLSADSIKSCLDAGKHKEEVLKDIADGGAVGVSGTPSFFVGKSNPSGIIEGTIIVGAQPYSAFQAAIDPLLK